MAVQRALLPIYRLRFNLLYQFGFIEVNPEEWVPYEMDNNAGHPKVSEAVLLDKIPAFSTPDEVVLLDIEIPELSNVTLQAEGISTIGTSYPQLSLVAQAAFDTLAKELHKQLPAGSGTARLNIAHVRRLYPLTVQAGQLLASRLDERIKRQPAVFEAVADQADQRMLSSETRLGSEALLEIAGFANERLDEALLQDVAKAVSVRLGRREIQTNDSFWIHLIAYDRYEPFPKNDYGYLYDLCVVFYRSLKSRDGKRGDDNGYEGTKFYKSLENNKASLVGQRITQMIQEVPWAQTLRDELTDRSNGLKQYLSAFIYLKLRGEFVAEDYQFSSKLLDSIRLTAKYFAPETRVVLQLLGGFLTFDKISGAYYEVMQIPLFQENGRKLSRLNTAEPKSASTPQAPSTSTFKESYVAPTSKPSAIRSDESAETMEWQLTPQSPKGADLFTSEGFPWMTSEKLVAKEVEEAPIDSQSAPEAGISQQADASPSTEPVVSKTASRGGRRATTPKKITEPKAPKALKTPKEPAAGSAKGRKAAMKDVAQQVSREAEAPSIEFPAPGGSPVE